MEWNTMTPSLWDWESVVLSNGRLGEAAKQAQPIDWGIEGDGGIGDGSVYSSAGGGCSGSDLGNGSTSKGSGSASVNSSSKRGVQESKLKLQMIKNFPNDLNKNKELGRAQVAGTSQYLAKVGSGEPVIGLKLGKRTYFEDICAESSVKASSASPTSSDNSIKKSKVSYHSMQIPRCQVEGCNLDLTAAKEYHRKHKVCENHSKCPLVIIAGNERRFCQQCSRFHELSEFDEKKRSCRRRLSDHNARRRKPQTEAFSFNSARLSSSFYGGKQHMNLVLNRVPPAHARPAANATWETPCSFQTVQVKESWLKTEKASGIGGHQHLLNAELPTAVPMICHDFYKLSPFKGTSAEVLNQGQEASSFASNLDMPPDFRRALSLLSPNKWGLAHRGPAPLDQLMHVNNSCTDQQAMHLVHQVLPFASSEYWQAEQAESRHPPLSLHSHSSHLQEFQLFKAPYESASLDNNHIH